jgi:hypothetical protein
MHTKASSRTPISADSVPLYHLVYHLKISKWYTFSAFLYRLFCTKISFCTTVPLEINFLWIFSQNRLRRLPATAATAFRAYQGYNANWWYSVTVVHDLFSSTNHSFEYQEEAHGVKG